MFRKLSNWITYNLAFPLVPIVLALLISYLRTDDIDVKAAFGGTELLFLSLTLLATTKNDLENLEVSLADSPFYVLASNLLPLFAFFTATFFGIVFADQNIQSIGLRKESTANFSIAVAVISICVSVSLQIFMSRIRRAFESSKSELKSQ